MTKNKRIMKQRDIEKAARIKKAARIVGVSEREVRLVLADERKNEKVVDVMVQLHEHEVASETLLLKAVRQLVPF